MRSHPGPIPGPDDAEVTDIVAPIVEIVAPTVDEPPEAKPGGDGGDEPARGGGVVFASDGDRDELDSLPEPSEDDDESLPHPFSSPLAINPLRHESV